LSHALDKFFDGLGLVAFGFEFGDDLEIGHESSGP
jgi:hypothetical protein